MMAICPECGKRHVVTWPDLNPFKRGDEYYCSSNCYEVSVNRDLSKIKEAALIRRQKKLMKYKKDGTPAKKPGRKAQKQIEIPAGEFKPAVDLSAPAKKVEKPEGNMTVIATKEPPKVPTVKLDGALRIETPETGKVDVVPVLPEIMQPASYEGMVIREVEGTFGRYRYSDIGSAEYIDFESTDRLDTLSFTVEQWKKFREEQVKAARVLGVKL